MIESDKRSILITGATGLVGSHLVQLALKQKYTVYAPVRNLEKVHKMLGSSPMLHCFEADLTKPITLSEPVDYIVHGANPTSSKSFIDDPVGTINICVEGTKRMLEFSLAHHAKFLYLSSGEVYGQFAADTVACEDVMGTLDPFAPRASYPEAKRLCETLCAAYAAQYGLHAMVARLGVILGPLSDPNDNRLLAQFARCAHKGQDILLYTAGRTIRSYCCVDDAAHALILLLEKGTFSTVYNVANPDMTFSVREIADRVSASYPKTKVQVQTNGDPQKMGYLPKLKLQMDISRLLALGWVPKVSFEEGFAQLYQSI